MTGAVSIISASAKGKEQPAGQSNPIVPNTPQNGGVTAEFQSPQRAMGKTGLQVSILGVGGYHLGAVAGQPEVNDMVAKALDHGINFFDNAWEYYKGASEERLGTALKGKRDKAIVMTKVCTHGRKKDVAMQMLEESLTRLQTDHLDVWQVHEVVYYNDPEKCYAQDGVLEALAAAKQQGKVRFVGFTGHKNPSIHLAMLNGGFPFDTVQMPINVMDAHFRSFTHQVMPVAIERGIGVLAMKTFGDHFILTSNTVQPIEALHYGLTQPVSTVITGIDSMAILDQALDAARTFKPLTQAEIKSLLDRTQLAASDGKFELFKTTSHFDGTAANPKWLG